MLNMIVAINSTDPVLGGTRAYSSEYEAIQGTITLLKSQPDYDGDELKAERIAKEFVAVNLRIYTAKEDSQCAFLIVDTFCTNCIHGCLPFSQIYKDCMASLVAYKPPLNYTHK